MATLDEQIKYSVESVNEDAQILHNIIHGTDEQTVTTDNGEVRSIAKIFKDTQDNIDSITSDITIKSSEVSQDKVYVENIKSDIEALKNTTIEAAKKSGVPIGQLAWFAMSNIPNGYLKCDGSTITKELFPELCKVLNNGDETILTAILPQSKTDDGRGRFLRDVGTTGIPLTTQEDELKAHSHTTSIIARWNDHNNWSDGFDNTADASSRTLNFESSKTGGEETRPASLMAVLCIKAFNGVINDGNLNAAALSTEIQNNNAAIATKADKSADAIAAVYCAYDGAIQYSNGVKSVSRIAPGKYKIILDDALIGKNFDVLATVYGFASIRPISVSFESGEFEIWTFWNNAYSDFTFTARAYERKGEV